MPLLTVFTPAYNRAHTIGRTYESLLKQSNKDFIWLIVDDGSSDNTQELVKEWMSKDNGFEIRYIHKENGGMHTAHNVAYEHIDTLLNVCIDSDDCLAEDGINKILNKWEEVKDLGYAGIIGLDADLEGNIIGKGFPEGLKETTLSGYYANGGAGDKKLVYRTDVINKYPPYPVFKGEKYVGLGYKYTLIDQDYKLVVLDDILCNVEYQPNGSSATMWRQYKLNPNGFREIRKQDMLYMKSYKRVLKSCIHYIACSFISHNKNFIKDSPKKLLTTILTPFGFVFSIVINYKAKKGN
ncbi:MAG: glycosyltransferase family 2 protein [Catenibacterium mitsuokai]|nr:glycosyltransferase family 2 protein [Catenibacterium mitsuokai]MDD6595623.1 glycosyltransferase family 2 protein [Catenibacterium mitsuokai]